MRSTLAIIIAVKECEPVTEEELRLALVAESNVSYFYRHDLQGLIEAIEKGVSPSVLKMKAQNAKQTIESMFRGHKTPVDTWLGPGNTPGTEENKARMTFGKKLFKAATGEDL